MGGLWSVCKMFKCCVKSASFFVFAMVLGLSVAGPASAIEETKTVRPYLAFNLASNHIGAARAYNEINPGIGFGLAFSVGRGEISPEIGAYKNSFSRRSTYAAVTYDLPVAELSPTTELRLGGFLGLVHYPGDTQKFRDGGAIMVGDAVMLAGISATWRQNDRTDLRLRIMPGGSAAKALVTLQLGIRY